MRMAGPRRVVGADEMQDSPVELRDRRRQHGAAMLRAGFAQRRRAGFAAGGARSSQEVADDEGMLAQRHA